MRQTRSFLKLDTRRLLTLVFFVLLFTMSVRELRDPDFWWHLATGRYIWQAGSIPSHDVFSYTVPHHHWITHEWLSQVVIWALYLLGGLPLLILMSSLAITLSFALVYVQCEGRPHLAVFAVLLGAVASAVTWGVRPQMFNLLLAAAFTLLFHLYKFRGRNLLWLYPALTALWVNLHSGYFLGLVLLGCFIVGEGAQRLLGRVQERTLTWQQIRNLAIVLVLSGLAALLNPNTYEILIYPFETLGSRAMQTYIQEWASPNFHQAQYWPFALLLLGTAAAMALSRQPVDLTDLLLFGGFGMAGLVSGRHISLFAVVVTPILTRYLVRWPVRGLFPSFQSSAPSRSRGIVTLNWALLLVIVVVGALRCARVIGNNPRALEEFYPLAALDYVERSDLGQARMYNSYNWGGYLLWLGYEVYIDGRADVYGDDFINEYLLAYHLHGDWRRPLDKYDVDYVLIESGAAFATLLEESADWQRVYRDDVAVIFVRVTGEE
ncbi:MAG: hypothetical protein SVX38_02390 [Chloroflexota bacterium]|nr:hypothetical protein [Chloroflexota bacterium]